MIKYRANIKGRFGRILELVEFVCASDAEAAEAVMEHIVFHQTAEIWQSKRLVSRIVENGVVWQSGRVARQ